MKGPKAGKWGSGTGNRKHIEKYTQAMPGLNECKLMELEGTSDRACREATNPTIGLIVAMDTDRVVAKGPNCPKN